MLSSKKPITLVIFLMLFVTVVASPVCADQGAASAAISSAKATIVNCYSAIKEAEFAGANITVLIGTMNEAGSLLSQAELAYAVNDFDVALNLAIQGQNRLSNFVGEANNLREVALQQQNQDFLINVVGSLVGTFLVILVGLTVWRLLKKKCETSKGHRNETPRV